MRGWIVVMTKPNCEGIAEENLLQQGYGCYYPRFKAVLKSKQVVKRPLFPRYIFAFVDQAWYSIKGTRGVSYVLMDDTGPARISASVIESLRSKEDDDGFILLGKRSPTEKFEKGESVRATEGPLMGLDLIYDGMAAVDRVRVLTSLLGRQVPVTIDPNSLISA